MAKKYFDEKDMYDNAYDCLRRRYPASEGWAIYPQDHHGTYIPDYVIEKRWGQKIFKVVAEVKKFTIMQKDIDQLNAYASKLAGPNVSVKNKVFIIASGADTSIVPDDIDKIFLKGFTNPN